MSYSNQGLYTAAAGMETAVAGNSLQSAVWDAGHADIRKALTAVGQSAVGVPAYRNILSANGGFEVWQRGAGSSASFTVNASTTAYTADRWYITTGANQQHTVSAVAGLVNGSNLACAIQRVAGQTGTTAMIFGYPLDTDEVIRLRGQVVSLNFQASTGANWSPTNGTFTATLYVGTGTVQKAGAAAANFTSPTTVLQISKNLAAGSAATNINGISSSTVPTNATQGELQFAWTPVGTAGANDILNIDDVMLDASTFPGQGFASPYERLPFDLMLTQCKRHYQKTFGYSTAPAQSGGLPNALAVITAAAAKFGLYWQHQPISLRATAAYTTYSPSGATANWIDNTTSASLTVTVDTTGVGPNGVLITGATASNAGDNCFIHAAADSGI